jgi:membrane-associated phospholipid phosphatase
MRERLLAFAAVASAVAFAGVYFLAVRNSHGISLDRDAFARLSGNAPAPYKVVGERTLRTIDMGTIAGAFVLLACLALVRRRAGRALAAGVIVIAPVLTAELLKRALPTPAGRPPTFPSGHTSVAVSIGFALVIAVPPVLRVTAALVGAAYGAAIAFAVVVLGWHYPSDAIGSFFLCSAWVALVALALRGDPPRFVFSTKSAALAAGVVAVTLLAAAAIASRHPVAVSSVRSRPAVAAAAVAYGALSLALFAALTPLVGERGGRRRPRLQSAS